MAGDSIPLWRILWRYNADGFRVMRMNKCRVAGSLEGTAEPGETDEAVRARMMEAVVSFVRESRSLTLTIELSRMRNRCRVHSSRGRRQRHPMRDVRRRNDFAVDAPGARLTLEVVEHKSHYVSNCEKLEESSNMLPLRSSPK
jgi:hypothetical protein